MKRSISHAFTKNTLAAVAVITSTALLMCNLLCTVVTAADDVNHEEYVDTENTCYFEDPEGHIWAFDKIYWLENGEEFSMKVMQHYDGKGVICHLYTGEEKPSYVMPYSEQIYAHDTEGEFEVNGEKYQYDIIANIDISPNDRRMLFSDILTSNKNEAQEMQHIQNLKRLDFKKDGEIDIADVVLLNKRYMNTPSTFCTYFNEDDYYLEVMDYNDFYNVLLYNYNKGKTDVMIRFGDKVPENEPAPAPAIITSDNNLSAVEMVKLATQLGTKTVELTIG